MLVMFWFCVLKFLAPQKEARVFLGDIHKIRPHEKQEKGLANEDANTC